MLFNIFREYKENKKKEKFILFFLFVSFPCSCRRGYRLSNHLFISEKKNEFFFVNEINSFKSKKYSKDNQLINFDHRYIRFVIF